MIRIAQPTDAAAMLEIYGPFVRDTPVSFETEVPTVEAFAERIRSTLETHPWLVWDQNGVVGYAYATPHRSRQSYQWSAEVSAYVHESARGRSLGRQLYARLFEILAELGYVNAYAGIVLPNQGSITFHESMGFSPVGVYEDIGWKFDEWHSVGWWQLRLQDDKTPPTPLRPFSSQM